MFSRNKSQLSKVGWPSGWLCLALAMVEVEEPALKNFVSCAVLLTAEELGFERFPLFFFHVTFSCHYTELELPCVVVVCTKLHPRSSL